MEKEKLKNEIEMQGEKEKNEGAEDGKNTRDDFEETEINYFCAICNFESTIFELFFKEKFEEIKRTLPNEWNSNEFRERLQEFNKLAQVMDSPIYFQYLGGDYPSVKFKDELERINSVIKYVQSNNGALGLSSEGAKAYTLGEYIKLQEDTIKELEDELEHKSSEPVHSYSLVVD